MASVNTRTDKIIGVLIGILTPVIVIYLIATLFILFRLVMGYVLYGEVNPNLSTVSALGLGVCNPEYEPNTCYPPLDDLRYFIEWNALTRLVLVVSVIWIVILAAEAVLQRMRA